MQALKMQAAHVANLATEHREAVAAEDDSDWEQLVTSIQKALEAHARSLPIAAQGARERAQKYIQATTAVQG